MKILYVVPYFGGYGGVARTLIHKANYFADVFGYDITLCALYTQDTFYFPISDKVKTKIIGINPFLERGLKRIPMIFRLKRIIKNIILEERPDIVVSFSNIIETFFISRMKGSFVKILETHGNYGAVMSRTGLLRKISFILTNHNIKKSDCFVVLTNKDAESYFENGFKMPTVIPNASPLIYHGTENSDCKNVMAVGRYDVGKNFESLIRIWGKISQKFPDWKLKIYGQGPMEQQMRTQIVNLGLENCVSLEYTENIEKAYLESSIQVMTSRHEGLPMTLLESCSLGIPAIAYDINCGPSDVIVDGKSGFLITPFDENEFAEKLSILMADSNLRKEMGCEALRHSKLFNDETVMNKWESLFTDLVNQKQRKRNDTQI